MGNMYDELGYILKGGRNGEYRKVSNNTYVIKTSSPDGEDWMGVQLHGTVVFAVRSDGVYAINNGGWCTQTTARRIHDYLLKVGSPHRVNMRKSQMYIDGVPYHASKAIFDARHSFMVFDSACFPYRNDIVAEKNRKAISR